MIAPNSLGMHGMKLRTHVREMKRVYIRKTREKEMRERVNKRLKIAKNIYLGCRIKLLKI